MSDVPEDQYRRINPQNLMPLIEWQGEHLTQSTAILEMIEEMWPQPSLLPKDPVLRSQIRAFANTIAADIHPISVHRVRNYLSSTFGLPHSELVEKWYRHWTAVGFAGLEKTLADRIGRGPFAFGAEPTLADLYLVPHMRTARGMGCSFDAFPRLQAVFAHCDSHDAFRAAAPENQPDVNRSAFETALTRLGMRFRAKFG